MLAVTPSPQTDSGDPKFTISPSPFEAASSGSKPPRPKALWNGLLFGSYLFGSLCFLVGSTFFYPSTSAQWGGKGYDFGAYCFVVGCVLFIVGTNMDFIDLVWSSSFVESAPFKRVVVIYNSMSYVVASWIFFLGAVFFLPDFFKEQPEIGCIAFIVGCSMFSLSSLIDMIKLWVDRVGSGGIGGGARDEKLAKAAEACLGWSTCVFVCTIIGAILFIVGSYFYLPQFTSSSVHPESNDDYVVRSTNCFVVGSVFFILSAMSQVSRTWSVPRLCPKNRVTDILVR